jgi:hypothetical protein
MAGKPAWNKGRRLEDCYDPATAKRPGKCTGCGVWRPDSESEIRRRRKLSQVAKERQLGRYRRGSGRGKKGWYREFWCDSSYELAFVVHNLDHGIAIKRNWTAFPYLYQDRVRRWLPDFVLADGSYVEIKGYETDQARAKFAAFQRPLRVLRQADLAPMLS